MLKRTLLTMTALSSLITISPALNDAAMAGQFNKPMIRMIAPQVKLRIDTRRLVNKAAKTPAANEIVQGGPQPEPPTSPAAANVARQATPSLPRPRPYDEIAEAGNDTGVGPDTGYSRDDKPFDEEQIAAFPAFWGENAIDILYGLGHGALDGAFENAPDAVDPFAPRNNRPGDLADFNPGDNNQPGGPFDPNAHDQVPSFFADDPRNPNGNGGSQGYSSPSQAFGDPRAKASDGDLPNQQWMSDNGADHVGTDVQPGENGHTTWIDMWKTPGSEIFYTEETDEDGNIVSGSAFQETFSDSKKRIRRHFMRDENGDYIFVGDESFDDEDLPDGEDSQPGVDPSKQEEAAAQAWICNNTPWMCRGGGGGSTPYEMLTQPAQPGDGADSIMDTDDGPALGREAVTNSGDPEWNLEGNGGGGGSSSTPDDMLSQPGPDGPGGPIGG